MLKFAHDIAGGQGNLIATSVQSPNFVHDVSGWQIARDGSAEFNDLTIRGTFYGTDFVINSSGMFFYSPSEGTGNLIVSIASAAGTDPISGQSYPKGFGLFRTSSSGGAGYIASTAAANEARAGRDI